MEETWAGQLAGPKQRDVARFITGQTIVMEEGRLLRDQPTSAFETA